MGQQEKSQPSGFTELDFLRRRVRELEEADRVNRKTEQDLRAVEQELQAVNEQIADTNQSLQNAIERANTMALQAEVAYIELNQIFNASHDGIWVVDRNRRIIRINDQLLAILKQSRESATSRTCRDIFPCPECRNDHCALDQIISGERTIARDIDVVFDDGRKISFILTATPFQGLDGEIIGVVEAFKDITDRKQAEAALQNANRELERLATLDGLTQLANRRLFDEYLEREWNRQRRDRQPLALILGDVDHFKQFNDTYGHQAGDDCLRAVARAMREQAHRPADLTARYGGEEFAVILPNTDTAGALHVANTIRQAVADLLIPHAHSSAADHVTLSLGVACLIPRDDSSPKQLIDAADNALYRAKSAGRNRCIGE